MIHKVFSVYDQQAKAFLPPFILPEEGMAVRTFSDCINNREHQFGKHPGDYTLMCLGTFDDSSGEYEVFTPQRTVGNGVIYKQDDEPLAFADLTTQQMREDHFPSKEE